MALVKNDVIGYAGVAVRVPPYLSNQWREWLTSIRRKRISGNETQLFKTLDTWANRYVGVSDRCPVSGTWYLMRGT